MSTTTISGHILLLASYCGDEDENGCTDTDPCPECIQLCNRAVVEDAEVLYIYSRGLEGYAKMRAGLLPGPEPDAMPQAEASDA